MERPVAAETSPPPLYKGQEFSSLSGSVSVVEIFVFIFYFLMFFSTDGILEESGTPMAY
jgi:hypothetical protein